MTIRELEEITGLTEEEINSKVPVSISEKINILEIGRITIVGTRYDDGQPRTKFVIEDCIFLSGSDTCEILITIRKDEDGENIVKIFDYDGNLIKTTVATQDCRLENKIIINKDKDYLIIIDEDFSIKIENNRP